MYCQQSRSFFSINPRTLVCIVLACFSQLIWADELSEAGQLYAELGAARASVQIDNTDFDFEAAELRFGGYIYQNIGLEVHFATAFADDNVEDLALKFEHSANLLVRFETPEREGFKLLLLGGYGQTKLNLRRGPSSQPGDETFKNTNFGLGANYRWQTDSPLSAGLKWHRYYAEGGVNIDLTSLSFNLDF